MTVKGECNLYDMNVSKRVLTTAARQFLIISLKLSFRRLIKILSNPTDDKRWKVVTILMGLSYCLHDFIKFPQIQVTMTSAPILAIQATHHLMQVHQCTGMLHVVSNTVNEAPHLIEMTESIS